MIEETELLAGPKHVTETKVKKLRKILIDALKEQPIEFALRIQRIKYGSSGEIKTFLAFTAVLKDD